MTKKKDDPADQVPYQQAAQVRQLVAERETAVAYGQKTRIAAVDKQLKELGVTLAEDEPKKEKAAPRGRSASPPARQTAAATEKEKPAAPAAPAAKQTTAKKS